MIDAAEIIRAARTRSVVAGIAGLLSLASVLAATQVFYSGWVEPLRGGLALVVAKEIAWLLPPAAGAAVFSWILIRVGVPPAPAPIVVWLRKFHQTGRSRTPFHRVLRKACAGLGVPITVRDTRFPASFMMALGRLLLVTPMLAIGLELFWAFSLFVLISWFGNLPGGFVLAFGLSLAATAAVGWFVYGLVVKSRGVIAIGGSDAPERTRRLLDGIERRPYAYPGFVVLKTTDEHWQDVLRLTIKRASVVIVDVSETSSNVEWEIGTALELHQPERLILAQGIDSYRMKLSSDDNPSGTDWIRNLHFGDRPLPDIQGFRYPAYRDRRGWPTPEILATRKLRSLLAASLASAGGRVGVRWTTAAVATAAAVMLGAVSLLAWKARPLPPSAIEALQIVLTSAGVPQSMIKQSDRGPLPRAPSEAMIYSLRYVNELENHGRYEDAVTESTVDYGEPENLWHILALNRAQMLAGKLDCTKPAVVSVSNSGLTINGASADEGDAFSALYHVTQGYGVVLIVPGAGVRTERIVELFNKLSPPHHHIVLAGSLSEISQHCGTKAAELVRVNLP